MHTHRVDPARCSLLRVGMGTTVISAQVVDNGDLFTLQKSAGVNLGVVVTVVMLPILGHLLLAVAKGFAMSMAVVSEVPQPCPSL